MTRPRGNATSRAHQTQRQAKVAEELTQNPAVTQEELAAKVGTSVATVKRDLNMVNEKLREQAGDAVADYREQQLAELSKLKETLHDAKIRPARKVEVALQIIDREIRLLGTEAPKKLLVAVGVPVRLVTDLQVAVGQMSEPQLEELIGHAHEILSGKKEERPVGIQWLPPANNELGFTPQTIVSEAPKLTRPRPAGEPKQLPPVIEAEPVTVNEDEITNLLMEDRFGDLEF